MEEIHTWKLRDKLHLEYIQNKLAKKVSIKNLEVEKLKIIAGYDSLICNDHIIGALSYFDNLSSTVIETQTINIKSNPTVYETGYLSLIEIPIFKLLWDNKIMNPDIVVVDGNGILHQRRCGLATHLSFLINKPTFGIGKKLIGGVYSQFKLIKGNYKEIIWNGEIVGVALCTRDGSNPVYISIGNNITIKDCINITLKYSNFKIPELTRQPDLTTREVCRSLQLR